MEQQVESEKSDLICFFCALYYIKILNENITNEMYTIKNKHPCAKELFYDFLDEYLYKRTIFSRVFLSK